VEGSSPGTMKHLTVDGPVFIGNTTYLQFTRAISYLCATSISTAFPVFSVLYFDIFVLSLCICVVM